MANKDFWALLTAGLDTKESAKAINQQIKTDLAKSLKEVELTFKLDTTAFKEVDKFIKGTIDNVQALKKEVNELNKLSSQVPTRKLENTNNERRTNIRAEAASKGLGEGNIVKEFYDPQTKELTGAIIEVKNYRNEIEKLKVSFQDGILQSTSLTAVSALNEELKESQKQIQHNAKAWKDLEAAQVKQGPDDGRAAKQAALETDTLEQYIQMIDAVTRAYEQGELSQTSYKDQVAQIDAQLEKTTMELDKHSMKLADDSGFKQAKQALNDYKKDYNELLKLQLKEQTNPEGLTQAEREQLGILQQRIQGQEELINKYEVTKTQLAEIKTRADQAFKVDLAKTEIDSINKDVAELSKLYEELDKQKTKAFEGDLKNKEDIGVKKRIDDIEEEIRARKESLEVTRQTADGQVAATNALNQVEEKANSIAETREQREAKAIQIKEQVLSNTRGNIVENEKFNTSLFKSGKAIDSNTAELQDFIKGLHSGKASISDVKKATDSYGSSLLKVTGIADAGEDKVSKFTYYIDEQTGAVRRLGNELSNNVSRSMKFSEQITHAAKKMAIWGIAARALYGSLRMIREGFTFIEDLDKDLTQAAVVMGKTRDEVKGLAQDYANLGIEMGKTVKEISKVNTELLRQGLSIQESSARLETVIKLSATGQVSTEEALRVVTTAVNAMQESHEHAADVILKASNISASSVEQLGEAFTKAASSAFATGMEIEQVTGILATMLEVTQEGPSQLGTSLKTILARFNRVNEETGEWNENLNKVQEAIESVGVRFVNADGQIRNTYDILADLADIWPTITKNQQAYIATTSAGVRMQNRFFAIMNNFERVKTITDATAKSAGTMNRAYLTYLDSVEAASNRTKASLEQLWINTINSEAIKWLYDIASGLIRIVDQIGVLNAVLTITAARLLLNKTLLIGLATASASFKGATLAVTSFSGVLKVMGDAIRISNAGSAMLSIKGLPALTGALRAATVAGWGAVAPFAPWVAGIIAVVGAIALLGKGIPNTIEAQRAHKQSLIDLNNTYLDNTQNQEYYRDELKSLGNEYEEFNKKIEASGLSADKALSTEEFQRFTEVQEKMLSIVPDLTTETDVYGNSVVVLTDGVKGLIEQYNEFIDTTSEEFKAKHKEIMENATEDFNEYYDKLDSLAKKREKIATQKTYDVKLERLVDLTEEEIAEARAIIDKETAEIHADMANTLTQITATWFAANQDALGDFEASMLDSGALIRKALEDGMSGIDLGNYLDELFSDGEFDVMNEVVDATNDSLKRINEEMAAGALPYKEYVKLMEEEIEAGKELLDLRLVELYARKAILVANGEDTTAIQMEIDGINGLIQAWKNEIQVAAEAEESQNQFIMGQAKKFSEATDKLYKYQDLLTKLADGYYETKEIVDEVTKSYPELIGFLGDETELREEILRLINEEQIAASEGYLQLMGDSKAYYEGARAELDALLAKAYGVRVADLRDAENFNHAKEIAENLFLNRILDAHKGLYDTLGQLRGQSLEQQLLEIAAIKRSIGSSAGITGKGKEMFETLSALESDLKHAASVLAEGLPEVSLPERTEVLGGGGGSATEEEEKYQVIVDAYQKINDLLQENQRLLDYSNVAIERAEEGSVEHLEALKSHNQLLRDRQELLKLLNIQNRAERDSLIETLEAAKFQFEGEGDAARLINPELVNSFKDDAVVQTLEKAINRFYELQTAIPPVGLEWWDLLHQIEGGDQIIKDTIQGMIDELETLKDELEEFDYAGQLQALNDELDTAKFTHWIDTMMLGLEKFANKSELLNFKLDLFDSNDYENQAVTLGELFENSKDELAAYQAEWDRLSAITPRNAEEAASLASAMEKVQDGMRGAYVEVREYQRALERLQLDSLLDNFAQANKQLELQLSIIDNNLQSIQDGILPDFSVDMIMALPDFSDIFTETASENERIYNEQVSHEEQIAALKQESIDGQLLAAQKFYDEEKRKLKEHYAELLLRIAEKEEELLAVQEYWDDKQRAQIETANGTIEGIIGTHLSNVYTEYDTKWGAIVGRVQQAIADINSAIAGMASMPSGGSGGSTSGGSTSGGSTGRTVQVNPDGRAPSGLPVGTVVKTGGGDYKITKVKPDGSYESEKIKEYATGGVTDKRETALVGEEGYELGILPSGKTVLFGKNGSELVNIPKGTTVVPHDETKEILGHTGNIDGKNVNKYADGNDGVIPKHAFGAIGIGTAIAVAIGSIAVASKKLKDTTDELDSTTKELDKESTRSTRSTRSARDDKALEENTEAIKESTESTDDLVNAVKAPDFQVTMTEDFRYGTGKYAGEEYTGSGFEGYDKYSAERETNIKAISGLTALDKILKSGDSVRDWVFGANIEELIAMNPYVRGQTAETITPQITTEIILDLIDEQLLADTVARSLMRVDLLEQQKISNATYIADLKLQYDNAMDSGSVELARETFELYQDALEDQMAIEQAIQAAIRQRYEMEFALMDKKLAKEEKLQSSLEKDLKLLTLQNPNNTNEILRLNEEILQSQINQGNQIASSITGLIAQRDILEVGSSEWNIINDKIEEYEDSLKDSNISIAEMNKQLAEIQRNDLFKQFEDRIRASTRLLKVLNYELGLLYEDQRPESLELMEKKLIELQNESNIAKENLRDLLNVLGSDYKGDSPFNMFGFNANIDPNQLWDILEGKDFDTTGMTEQEIQDLDSLVDKVRESETSIVDLQKAIEQFRVEKVFADLNNSLRNTVHNLEMLGLEMQLLAEDDFDNRINILNQQMKLTNNQIIEQTKAFVELQKVIQQNADERGFITEEELDKLNQAELAIKQTEIELYNLGKTIEQLEIDKMFFDFEQATRKTSLALQELDNQMRLLGEDDRDSRLGLMIEQLQETSKQAALFKQQYDELISKLNEGGLTTEEQQQLDDFNQKLKESEISVVELEKAIQEFKVDKVFADLNNTLRETEHILSILDLQMQLISENDFIGKSSIISKQIGLTNNKIIEQTKAYGELQKVIQQNADERGFVTEEELDKLNQAELSLKQLQVELANLEKLKLSNNFSSQLSDIEKQLFDGKTYDEANESLEKKIELENKFIDGLEKELEVQKLKDYAKQNEVALSKEQLKTLNAQGKVEKKSLERIQKQLEIKQLEQKLENLKSQKTIQQLNKKADGTWDFMYVADQDEIDNTTRELQDKRVELIQWERNITQESERKQLQDKANYLEKLRQITEKALNGEYETYDEFNNSILLLNETFLTDLTLDSEIKWGELLITFDEKLLGMKTSYLTYVAEMGGLADRLNKALNQVKVTPLPSIVVDDKDIRKFAAGGETSTTGAHWLDGEVGKPERVLSGQQTKDFNKLVANMPDMLKLIDMDNLSNVLKSAVLSTMNVAIPRLPQIAFAGNNGGGDQIFNIDKVEFPNITTADEATKAMLNLPNRVKQRTRIIGVD